MLGKARSVKAMVVNMSQIVGRTVGCAKAACGEHEPHSGEGCGCVKANNGDDDDESEASFKYNSAAECVRPSVDQHIHNLL